MSTPILATKLYIPPPRPKAVRRPRLFDRLDEGLRARLTLIAAPAGFGKSTLAAEWLAAGEHPVAWLSLDEADSDLTRFLTYLIAALQTVAPRLGEGIVSILQSAQPAPAESLLTVLLNEISAIPHSFVLVLDDYHVLDAKAIDQALIFLLDHLPPQMHLLITTREDPPLPLARLRARGQLVEVRAADLRFSSTETAEFLRQVMGVNLPPEQAAALEARTEGWIAGLQLAALSMRGQEDTAGFVHAFTGDNRYVVDYLVEEVLQRQPAPVRTFLLRTAILDRLSGPLCDAVTGQAEGSARLEALERGNFFVVPLDDKRRWYRYHHLFADVLSAHLAAEMPDQIPALHRRASEWYEQNGLPADAIRHALSAKDFGRAADLVERAAPIVRRSRQEAALLGWLQALPDELFDSRPVLSVEYVGALLSNGKLNGVEARLRSAERWLNKPRNEGAVVVDEEAFHRLPGLIAIYRAGYALALGNATDTLAHAHRALDLLPESEHLWRGAAAALLGLAYWTGGELEAAYQSYAEGMARLQQAGHISDAMGGAIALADIRSTQGRLRDAMSRYEQGLQLATGSSTEPTRIGVPPGAPSIPRGAADMYVGLSEFCRERNDLDAATQHLLQSKELGDHLGFPQNPYRWRLAMARIREAQGDLDGALDLLTEAERLYISDFYPNVRPIAALKARLWIAQGRLSEALAWVREQGLSAADDLTYLREFEHITLARLLVAQHTGDRADHSIIEATALLNRLLHAAVVGGRTGRAIEILALLALAHQRQGDTPASLAALARALTLAEPEGYIRMFVDEGPPMAHLLEKAANQGIKPTYARQLLRAFGDANSDDRTPIQHPPIQHRPTALPETMIEPLSDRELDVLRLLRTDLSGPEIARQLMVSLNTMQTHTKHIYSKLGVNSRRAAIRRAEELNLL